MFTRLYILLSVITLLSAHRISVSNVNNLRRIDKDGRIIGGKYSEIRSIPYQVSLQEYGHHFCGGAIYSKNIIVTAAHCVINKNPKQIYVRVGSDVNSHGGSLVKVSEKSVHDKYSDQTLYNDVALLLLSSPLKLGVKVKTISLASSQPKPGTKAIVSGWGQTEGEIISANLKSVHVEIWSHKKCVQSYHDDEITNDMICAYAAGKDACQGDSGGPLAYKGTLVGIVSWGSGCAVPGYPGVYSNIAVLRSWILKSANKLERAMVI